MCQQFFLRREAVTSALRLAQGWLLSLKSFLLCIFSKIRFPNCVATWEIVSLQKVYLSAFYNMEYSLPWESPPPHQPMEYVCCRKSLKLTNNCLWAKVPFFTSNKLCGNCTLRLELQQTECLPQAPWAGLGSAFLHSMHTQGSNTSHGPAPFPALLEVLGLELKKATSASTRLKSCKFSFLTTATPSPWAPFCDFLVHTKVYVHKTHMCVLHLCLVVLEPFNILHSFSSLFIVTVSVLARKYRMFPFSCYLTLTLLCFFLFYEIKFQLFSHHCKPQVFLLFMQYSILLSCSLFLK